jgi:hypothetical protein
MQRPPVPGGPPGVDGGFADEQPSIRSSNGWEGNRGGSTLEFRQIVEIVDGLAIVNGLKVFGAIDVNDKKRLPPVPLIVCSAKYRHEASTLFNRSNNIRPAIGRTRPYEVAVIWIDLKLINMRMRIIEPHR